MWFENLFKIFRKSETSKKETSQKEVSVDVKKSSSEIELSPYRHNLKKDSTDNFLVCTLFNEDKLTPEILKEVKEKSRKRALRHFQGKKVKHRVTEKNLDFIEFEFFRTSGKRCKIRWKKIEPVLTNNEKSI